MRNKKEDPHWEYANIPNLAIKRVLKNKENKNATTRKRAKKSS